MRIKKDKTNYRASGIIHRDNRHDKSVDGSSRPAAKKKNTKKWCKGREGRCHTLEWKESKFSVGFRQRFPNVGVRMEIVCSRCHKILEWDREPWPLKWVDSPPKKKQEIMEAAMSKYGNSQ